MKTSKQFWKSKDIKYSLSLKVQKILYKMNESLKSKFKKLEKHIFIQVTKEEEGILKNCLYENINKGPIVKTKHTLNKRNQCLPSPPETKTEITREDIGKAFC